MIFLYNLTIIIFLFIIILFLRELGITSYIYEEIYTHPKLKYLIKIFGDVLYMIGGSISGAVIYTYYTTEMGFQITAFLVGIIFIYYGAYLRDSKLK